jgi:DNA-directed RNA polymerase I, II, and III subunit RPABC2
MSSYFDKQFGGEDNISVSGSESEEENLEEEEAEEEEVDDLEEDDLEEDEDLEEEGDLEEEDDLEEEGKDLDEDGKDLDEDGDEDNKDKKRGKKIPIKTVYKKSLIDEDQDDDEDEDGELYLQKFDNSLNENYLVNFHPECVVQNYDEILSMVIVLRDKDGIIVDDLHKTIPYLTKYEKARILGQRAKQINSGSQPFIKVPENVIDGYIIAELELKEKKIPFIIRRPLPNGGSEYWSIKDLEDISF